MGCVVSSSLSERSRPRGPAFRPRAVPSHLAPQGLPLIAAPGRVLGAQPKGWNREGVVAREKAYKGGIPSPWRERVRVRGQQWFYRQGFPR
ncbi:hypothetical protein GCM10027189_24080 [Rufibacter soli]